MPAGLQFRDFRNTAVVELARQGATVPQIAALARWSIAYTTRIVDTYCPTDDVMAGTAVTLPEAARSGRSRTPPV